MRDILILILEKVKTGALSTEEGALILEELIQKKNPESETVDATIESESEVPPYGKAGSYSEEKAKSIFDRFLEGSEDFEKISEQVEQKIKKGIREWLIKESTK